MICIYTHNRILFSHNKEGNSDIYKSMGDLEGIMLNESKQMHAKSL